MCTDRYMILRTVSDSRAACTIIFFTTLDDNFLVDRKLRRKLSMLLPKQSCDLIKQCLSDQVTTSTTLWLFILLVKVINFLRPKHLVLKEGLHGGRLTAHFVLMSTFKVIVIQPLIEIFL